MIRRRRSPVRVLVVALGTIVTLAVVVAVAAVFLVDPNVFKPRLIAELSRAIGRDVAIDGAIRLQRAFPPVIALDNVSIGNIPGGTQRAMATVRQVEAQLDPMALLGKRVQIDEVTLTGPDVLLETDAQGSPNWRFAQASSPGAAAGPVPVSVPSAAPDLGSPRRRVSITTIHVRDGVVTWHEGSGGRTGRLELPHLDAVAPNPDAPAVLSADGRFEGLSVALAGQTGPLTRLLARDIGAPWPVTLTLTTMAGPGAGARLAVSGTVTDPARARGYVLSLDGSAPDLASLALAGLRLPALKQLTASARLSDADGAVPVLSQLRLHVGPSDLSSFVPTLGLTDVEATANGLTQPMQGTAHGTLGSTPWQIEATLGSAATLLSRTGEAAASPFPVDLSAQAAGLSVTAKGGIASPSTLSGLDLAVQAKVADLGALAQRLGRSLPAVHDLTFHGHVADGPGGYSKAVVLTDAELATPAAEMSGDAKLTFGDRVSLQATLGSRLIDFDALRDFLPDMAQSPPTAAVPPGPPATAPPSTTAAPADAKAAPSVLDRPLPLAGLTAADADVSFTLNEVRSQGVSYRDVAGHTVLQGGRLTVDPLAGQTPTGRVEASLSVDATQPAPPVTLTLHAPGLAAKAVLGLFNLPDETSATIAVEADVSGAGATLRTLLASIDGRLGVAMVDGDVENRTVAALAGEVLRAARLPVDLGTGHTRLRCFAIRLDSVRGTATIRALVFDTARLLLQGSGALNLADDGLSLRLRPVVRLGSGPGVAVPVRVGGTLREPKFGLDVAGALQSGAAGAGLEVGRGFSPSGADRNGDLCPAALALARNGGTGPVPSSPPGGQATAGSGSGSGGRAADVLRGLIR